MRRNPSQLTGAGTILTLAPRGTAPTGFGDLDLVAAGGAVDQLQMRQLLRPQRRRNRREMDVQDLELLNEWRSGNRAAGETLLGNCYPVLYRFFANKVSGDVDDLVQLTMVALSTSCDKFENRCSFRSYILSIARFQLYEYIRRRNRSSAHLEYDTVTAFDLSPSPSTLAVARAEQQTLLEALRRIPLNFQIALELHYWEDLTGPELAEALGVPVDTAYSRVRKARELVKKQLRFLSAGLPGQKSDDQDGMWENALKTAVGD